MARLPELPAVGMQLTGRLDSFHKCAGPLHSWLTNGLSEGFANEVARYAAGLHTPTRGLSRANGTSPGLRALGYTGPKTGSTFPVEGSLRPPHWLHACIDPWR